MLHSMTLYSYFNISIIFRPSLTFAGLTSNLGSVRPAGYAVCDGNVSSSSFFLLATLQRTISSTCFDRFQPDLVIRTPDP